MFNLFQICMQLIFPLTCYYCQEVLLKGERILCIGCYLKMPKQRKVSSLVVEGKSYEIYSLFKFQKRGVIQHLIHEFKYNGKRKIGMFFGEEMSIRFNFFEDVKYVIPVPIHWQKEKSGDIIKVK